VGSTRHDLRLAVEEVCTNIIQHAYGGRPGPIRIDFRESGSRYLITIEDQAEPFDPSSAPAADLSSGWEERRPGGQGWHLVKNVVEEVRYERTAAPGNRLTLVKTKPPGGGRK
jgi:serine/threonine-protein kinase RsbW